MAELVQVMSRCVTPVGQNSETRVFIISLGQTG